MSSASPARAAALRMRELRQAEVEHLHRPSARDLDVRGFQIAMNDPLLVGRFEGLGDLLRDRQRLIDAESDRARSDRPASSPSTSSMTSARITAGCPRGRGCAAMLRMIQGGEHLGFAREPRERSGSRAKASGSDLHRDVAIQLRIASAIDLAHAAGAEGRQDFVSADPRGGQQRHQIFRSAGIIPVASGEPSGFCECLIWGSGWRHLKAVSKWTMCER